MRGEVKSRAQALVATLYQLEGSRIAIAERVKDLLTRKKYTFKFPETVCFFFQHWNYTYMDISGEECTGIQYSSSSLLANGLRSPIARAAGSTACSSTLSPFH